MLPLFYLGHNEIEHRASLSYAPGTLCFILKPGLAQLFKLALLSSSVGLELVSLLPQPSE